MDSAGAFTDALTYSFTPVKGTDTITVTVTLDNTYLSDPNRVFPVIIDPTVMISFSETADACVCSYTENTNYQMATQLRTGKDTDYGIRRSYIKFEIPSHIPPNSVTNAVLEIEKLSGVAPTVKAYRCTEYWTSSTITWKNQAAYTTVGQSSLASQYSSGSTWYTMNVTSIVQGWVNVSYSNFGFLIKDITEYDTSHWTTIYSSDAPSPHKPELHITYTTFWGCKNYRYVPVTDVMNCQGYAFFTDDKPPIFNNIYDDPSDNQLVDQLARQYHNAKNSADLLEAMIDLMELWLEKTYSGGRWEYGSLNDELASNQWMVVMRVGVRQFEGDLGYQRDYHFWYRTNTGNWAHKQGDNHSELLPITDLPTSTNTTGWDTVFDKIINNNHYYVECPHFYDSELVYYILTIYV